MVGALGWDYNHFNLHRTNNQSVYSWVHIGTCAICMSLLNDLAAMLCLAVTLAQNTIWEDLTAAHNGTVMTNCILGQRLRQNVSNLIFGFDGIDFYEPHLKMFLKVLIT